MSIDLPKDVFSKLTVELDEALGLLREFQQTVDIKNIEKDSTFPWTLLDQCVALCEEHSAAKLEPIRTVHHFACTGGSLICKCIASMPNTQLLSEVDPLHTPVRPTAKPEFKPTDMVTLLRQSTRGASTELLIDLFINNLETIYSNSINCGLQLIVRDHAHSHYCKGDTVPERPNLLGIIGSRFSTLSIVTVRDPIDSYLSLKANQWVHFIPNSFDEYCARYAEFLRSYKSVPIVRYEDFIKDPSAEMAKICNILNLPFNPEFLELFSVFKITGDSGRGGSTVKLHPRRPVDALLLREMEQSAKYQVIRSVLGYQ